MNDYLSIENNTCLEKVTFLYINQRQIYQLLTHPWWYRPYYMDVYPMCGYKTWFKWCKLRADDWLRRTLLSFSKTADCIIPAKFSIIWIGLPHRIWVEINIPNLFWISNFTQNQRKNYKMMQIIIMKVLNPASAK